MSSNVVDSKTEEIVKVKKEGLFDKIKEIPAIIKSKDSIPLKVFMVISFVVIVLRLLTSLFPSYKTDIGCYRSWGYYLMDNGCRNFYNDVHVVYGPVYVYLLWICGAFAKAFRMSDFSYDFIIKFWSVLSDLVGAYLIYLIGKKYEKARIGLLLAIVYAFNPAVVMNSSVWGQFDSFPATFILGVIYLFNIRKNAAAAVLFTIACVMKPQSGLFAPIVIILFFKGFSIKEKDSWRMMGKAAAGAFFAYIALILPFFIPKHSFASSPLKWVIDLILWLPAHYVKSVADYPYATANAFNIWTILGGQAVIDTERFTGFRTADLVLSKINGFLSGKPYAGLSFATWGYLFFGIIVLLSVGLLLKKKKSVLALYYSTFILYFGAFLFMTKMHERYLLPAIVFITVCILWDSRLWVAMLLVSACCFVNQWYLYYMSWHEEFWVPGEDKVAMYTAIVTAAVMVYSIYYLIRLGIKKKRKAVKISEAVAPAVEALPDVEAPEGTEVQNIEVPAPSKE